MGATWGRSWPRGGLEEDELGSSPRLNFWDCGCWRSVGSSHRLGEAWGWGCEAHLLGTLSRLGSEPRALLSSGWEVGLGLALAPLHPRLGARRRGGASAGAGWRLHSNGLGSPPPLAGLDPGRKEGAGCPRRWGRPNPGPPGATGEGKQAAGAPSGLGYLPWLPLLVRPCPNVGFVGLGCPG